MIKELVHDATFLAQKSEDATKDDKEVIEDLKDTLKAHEEECVGLAANMIGVKKRIIIVNMGQANVIMVNPKITKRLKPYQGEEACLSLLGGPRTALRFEEIDVEYLDENFEPKKGTFKQFIAQIIQHEVDHCNGVLI